MKNNIKLSLFLFFISGLSIAQTFNDGTFQYNVTSATEVNVEQIPNNCPIGSISIPENTDYLGDTYTVTQINVFGFVNCQGITSVNIPNSVTIIGESAFSNCTSLNSVTIPNSVTSIAESAFSNCLSLNSLTIPNSVTSIGIMAFALCDLLTSVTIPNSVTSLGDFAFGSCAALTSVTLSNSLNSIQPGTFSACSSLTSITIPNSVTIIGSGAFSSCSALTTVTIPNSVTSIESFAFSNSGLTSITIPNSVTSIGDWAFEGWGDLTSVVVNWSSPLAINATVFSNLDLSLIQLFIPSGTLAAYQLAPVWQDFSFAVSPILSNTICGATNVSMNQKIVSSNVGAAAYRFRVTGPNNAGSNWNGNTTTYITPIGQRHFRFSLIPGCVWGATYQVEVAAGDGSGSFGPYGAACNVTLEGAIPTSAVRAITCGTSVTATQFVRAENVNGAVAYRFRITGTNSSSWANNELIFVPANGDQKFRFSQIQGALPGTTYMVDVAIQSANGTWGAYGSACPVTLAGLNELVVDNNELFVSNKTLETITFDANASHNPFTTEFGLQVLNVNNSETINVTVYDMSGKLIERNAVNPMDIEVAKFGSNLASGMYMIEVRQGSNQAVIRQVKN